MKDDAERARATLISAMEHDKRSQRRISACYNTSITSDEAIKAIMLAFAQHPEGWVLVPREPTEAMTWEPWTSEILDISGTVIQPECARAVWSAMLDVAPIPGEE